MIFDPFKNSPSGAGGREQKKRAFLVGNGEGRVHLLVKMALYRGQSINCYHLIREARRKLEGRNTPGFDAILRHSRGTTRLCSPVMTRHCTKMVHLPAGKTAFSHAPTGAPGAPVAGGPLARFRPLRAFPLEISGLRTSGADDERATCTPSAWMISLVRSCPAPNRVPGVAHSNRAEVGHFS